MGVSKTPAMGSIHVVVGLLRSIVRSHRISRTLKTHTFFAPGTLNFKTSGYSFNGSFASFIRTNSGTDCSHIIIKKPIRSIPSFMTAHASVNQILTAQTIPFFAFRTIVWRFILYIAYKCAACGHTEYIFSWMTKNEMVDRGLYNLVPFWLLQKTVQVTDPNFLHAVGAFYWVQSYISDYELNWSLNAIEAESMTAAL